MARSERVPVRRLARRGGRRSQFVGLVGRRSQVGRTLSTRPRVGLDEFRSMRKDQLHTYIMVKRFNQRQRGLRGRDVFQIGELENFFRDEERAFDDGAIQVCIKNSNVWNRQFDTFKNAPGGGKSKYAMLPRDWNPSNHFNISDDVPHDRYTPLTLDEYHSQFYNGDDSTYDLLRYEPILVTEDQVQQREGVAAAMGDAVGNGSNGDGDSAAATAASGDNVRVGRGDEQGDSAATDRVGRGDSVGNGSGGDGDSAAAAATAASGDNVRVGRGDGREDSVVNGSGGRGRSDADAPTVSDENVQVGLEDSGANAGEGGAAVGDALNPIDIDDDDNAQPNNGGTNSVAAAGAVSRDVHSRPQQPNNGGIVTMAAQAAAAVSRAVNFRPQRPNNGGTNTVAAAGAVSRAVNPLPQQPNNGGNNTVAAAGAVSRAVNPLPQQPNNGGTNTVRGDPRLYDNSINLRDYNGLLERFGTGTEAQRREISAEQIAAVGSTAYIDPKCSICLYALNGRARVLPCGHVFHDDCITPSLRNKLECPICRKKFD